MAELTITEALAELKTIEKRLQKKRQFRLDYLARQSIVIDPLQADGGSAEAQRREAQAIGDLEQRKVAIRRAIARANATTTATVEGVSRTLADWLTWKREVAPGHGQFLATVRQSLVQLRKTAQDKGMEVRTDANASERSIVVNISEADLAAETEQHETVLGALDGQLSLKNATTTITIDAA